MKNVAVNSVWLVNGFRCVLLLGMFFLAGKLHAEIIVNTIYGTDTENINAFYSTLGEDASGSYVAFTGQEPSQTGFGFANVYFNRCTDSFCFNPEIITDNFIHSDLRGTSGSSILYRKNISASLAQLYVYDTQDGFTIPVSGVAVLGWGDIHGGYFVYTQTISTGVVVVLHNINDAQNGVAPESLSFATGDVDNPSIGSRYAVWAQRNLGETDYDVKAYDRLNETTLCVLCRGEVSDRSPKTSGAWIIYESVFPGDRLVLVAENLETGEIQQVKEWVSDEPQFKHFNASIDQNANGVFITYSFRPEGQDHDQIFLYQLSTQDTYQITDDQCDNLLSDVFADKITYTQHCDPSSSDVYVAHFEIIPDNPDDDEDGIPDDVDQCPSEDSTGLDANGDGCIDTLNDLTEVVEQLLNEEVIDATMATSLLQKVTNAISINDRENICAAVDVLQAFKSQIDAQRGKKISEDAADLLIEFTDNVISELLSSGASC